MPLLPHPTVVPVGRCPRPLCCLSRQIRWGVSRDRTLVLSACGKSARGQAQPCRPSLRGPPSAGFLVGFKQETLAKFLFRVFLPALGPLGPKCGRLAPARLPGRLRSEARGLRACFWLARVGHTSGWAAERAGYPPSGTKLTIGRASAARLAQPLSNYPGWPMASAASGFLGAGQRCPTCVALARPGQGVFGEVMPHVGGRRSSVALVRGSPAPPVFSCIGAGS